MQKRLHSVIRSIDFSSDQLSIPTDARILRQAYCYFYSLPLVFAQCIHTACRIIRVSLAQFSCCAVNVRNLKCFAFSGLRDE